MFVSLRALSFGFFVFLWCGGSPKHVRRPFSAKGNQDGDLIRLRQNGAAAVRWEHKTCSKDCIGERLAGSWSPAFGESSLADPYTQI